VQSSFAKTIWLPSGVPLALFLCFFIGIIHAKLFTNTRVSSPDLQLELEKQDQLYGEEVRMSKSIQVPREINCSLLRLSVNTVLYSYTSLRA
jgi:hypothetical protein